MRFQFLVENKTDHPDIMAEHGLSIYIEADHQRVLFDAGATDLLLLNAERMGVDLTAVDFAVVSHGHYDHTGGIPGFCTLNDTAPVYLHRDAFRKSYGLEGGRREKETCGLRWTQQEKEKLKDRLVLTDGPRYITENICITGTIP